MSATFKACQNELIGLVDGIDPFSAIKAVNRAFRDISESREWGFLRARGVVKVPNAVSTGTVNLTQNSESIQFDTDAAAVLDVFGLNPSVAQCQIKITTQGGPYSIIDYQPGGAATLDRAYQEDTDAASSYTLLRCYVSPPSDFLRFISINDALRAKPIRFGPRWTQQTLDRIDPQRSDTSEPYVFATYVYGEDDHTQYEIWPHPTVEQVFLLEYRKRGVREDLDTTGSLPDAISSDLLLARAKFRAYEFGASKATSAAKSSVFMALMREAKASYDEQLKMYKKQDKAQNPDTVVIHNERMIYPLDASWIQGHVPFNLDVQGW